MPKKSLTPPNDTADIADIALSLNKAALSELLGEQLLQHLLSGIILVDTQYRCVFANATCEQILSASLSQILASSIFDLLTPPAPNPTAKTAKISDKNADTVENIETLESRQQLVTQFEHTRDLHQAFIKHECLIAGITQAVQVDYGVSPLEYAGSFFYIIELWEKDRQSRIHQEQQQQAQHHVTRQLIRSMAHEVKNPLAGIYGASQLLQKQFNKNISSFDDRHIQKIQNYLGIVMDETQRLNNLVNQLLGSPTLPKWQRLNIHEPLEHVIALVIMQNRRIHFIRDYDLSLPECRADKDQMIQVFLNLINNAVQALTENAIKNPTITIQTRIAYQMTIGDIRHKSVVKISVIDNGKGIDTELLPQIFYPLVTGRANGTGLGLALVHDIIQRHQGMIDVTSAGGQTRFDVYLPWQEK